MGEQKNNYSRIAVIGTFWYYVSYYGSKLMVFLSTIVLARILNQADFGVASYAITILGFLDVFRGFGLDFALIYVDNKHDRTNTAFWLNLCISFALFFVVFIIGSQAQLIFNDERAVKVTQALALVYPLDALGMVQSALLKRSFSFGIKVIPEVLYNLGKGIISIILAFLGFSYWSLILGQIGGTALSMIAYWIVSPWRPRFVFSWGDAKELLHFSKNIAYVKVLNAINQNFTNLFIGRFFGAADLGSYTTAKRIPSIVLTDFCSVTSRVTYPIYARMRDSLERLEKGFFRTTRFTVLLTIPLGVGLFILAKPFVLLFLTEKWISAVPLVRLLTLEALLITLTVNAGDMFQALGKPELLMRINLLTTILTIIVCVSVWLSHGTIYTIGYGIVGVSIVSTVVIFNRILSVLQIKRMDLVRVYLPAVVSATFMGIVVYFSMRLTSGLPMIWQFILPVILGGLVYLLSLYIFFRDVYGEIIYVLKRSRQKGS